MDFGQTILYLPALVFSIVFHEVSHGWVAEKNGDPTARMMGRITLNPIPHIDPWGSILLPGILALMNTGFMFGYAKPVPVNVNNLHHPRTDGIKVAVAGPLSNLFLALVSSVLLALSVRWSGMESAPSQFFVIALTLNCVLAVFNLLPIPPLDGSWVLEHTLRGSAYETYRSIRPYGMLLLIGVIMIPPLSAVLIRAPVFFVRDQFLQVSELVLRMVS
jgi:Zn-dependent protease